MTRKLLLLLSAAILVLAGCGDDGADDATSGSGDPGGDVEAPAPAAGGGATVTIGDDTITLDASRCFLEEQESAGQTIEATAQADGGANADGDEVLIDFTRFAESSDFAGDDISVTIGDPFSPDSTTLTAMLDIGAVSIEGSAVSASGFEFTDDDLNPVPGAFEISC